MKLALSAFLFALAACSGGGGGSSAPPPPPEDMSGHFSGTWESASDPNHTLRPISADFVQNGTQITGSVTIVGGGCCGGGSVTGTVTGAHLDAVAHTCGFQIGVSLDEEAPGIAHLTGVYWVGSHAGQCTGDHGFIDVSPSSQ